MTSATLTWLVPLLVCPICRGSLRFEADESGVDGVLSHENGACGERYAVVSEIPRLIVGPARARFARSHASWFTATPSRASLAAGWLAGGDVPSMQEAVVSDFDYEWMRFSRAGTPELHEMYAQYFDIVDESLLGADRVVLDAGCGAGRWALEVAASGSRVIAIDLGESVDVARANTQRTGRVACVQADLHALPLAPASVDFAYCLGVIHHLERPHEAVARIADAVRPGGQVLVYLYYALDGRGPLFRSVYLAMNTTRQVTSRLPRPFLLAFAALVALLVYWPAARLSRLVRRFNPGLAALVPLTFYADRSFGTMLNDSVDRFGTRLERRYRRSEVEALLRAAGLDDVRFSTGLPYWHAVARAPRRRGNLPELSQG